ncbi:MAG: hypothetical protein WD794_10290 [Mycobacteriales bacterium]
MPSQGRRDNGLPSADWGALVDVDPRLSGALLDRLAEAGVAAYVEPALGSNTFTRAATLPDRPLDRLWVDAARAEAARTVVGAEVADLTSLLAEQDPGATAHGLVHPVPRSAARRVLSPPPLPAAPPIAPPAAQAGPPAAPPAPPARPPPAAAPDEEFRRIVEGFSREGDSPVPPWPVSEDVDLPQRRMFPSRPERDDDPPPQAGRRPRSEGGALPDWVEPEALEDDGHYVPPPPPPLPRLAPQKVAAAAALLAGVILMFAPELLLQDRTAFVGLVGVLLTAGGAVALVYLMRDAPPTDSGPDDGAVV